MEHTPATIMVVDDTPANLKLLQEVLQAENYRVLAFPSGKMALNAAIHMPPDLILLDINMPEMNGFEVCERLKSNDNLKDIPVLFISAAAETEGKLRAFSVGGVDYVTKPFEFAEVLARVKTHLALQRFRTEIVRKNQELDAGYKKLKELEALREALTHMIIHDLRSPLCGIMGFLDILREDLAGSLSKEHRDFLVSSRDAANELMHRIGTMLDAHRLEEGAMPLNPTRVNLTALAAKVVNSFSLRSLHTPIFLDIPEQAIEVPCDRDLMERVLINLLQNALKFSPRHGEVRVQISAEDSSVVVRLHDQGPGVPPEFRDAIFDRFVQVEQHENFARKGFGLGLAFCQLAVAAHGGTIGVECPSDGGSIFWFSLPVNGPRTEACG